MPRFDVNRSGDDSAPASPEDRLMATNTYTTLWDVTGGRAGRVPCASDHRARPTDDGRQISITK